MTRNQMGFIYAACLILMGLAFAGITYLIIGINDHFGFGVTVGLLLGIGLAGLASRNVREAP